MKTTIEKVRDEFKEKVANSFYLNSQDYHYLINNEEDALCIVFFRKAIYSIEIKTLLKIIRKYKLRYYITNNESYRTLSMYIF